MHTTLSKEATGLLLRPFDLVYASVVAAWVTTEPELRWLAPSLDPPLTPEKVVGWQRPDGYAFSLNHLRDPFPRGYGEVNRVRQQADELWIGHIIVHPHHRNRGLGRLLVRALVSFAFEQLSARRVALVVFPDNEAAIRCYRRVGFRLIGEEHHRLGSTGPPLRLLRFEIENHRAGQTLAQSSNP